MGIYSNKALLPSKERYISTYAGKPIAEVGDLGETLSNKYYAGLEGYGKINELLGSYDVLEGDQGVIDNAGKQIGSIFDQFVESGNYEDSLPAVMKASGYLMKNKAIKTAQGDKKKADQHLDTYRKLFEKGQISAEKFSYVSNKLNQYRGRVNNETIETYMKSMSKDVDFNAMALRNASQVKPSYEETQMRFDSTVGKFVYDKITKVDPKEVQKVIDSTLSDPSIQANAADMNEMYGEGAGDQYLAQVREAVLGAIATDKVERAFVTPLTPKEQSLAIRSGIKGFQDPEVSATPLIDAQTQGPKSWREAGRIALDEVKTMDNEIALHESNMGRGSSGDDLVRKTKIEKLEVERDKLSLKAKSYIDSIALELKDANFITDDSYKDYEASLNKEEIPIPKDEYLRDYIYGNKQVIGTAGHDYQGEFSKIPSNRKTFSESQRFIIDEQQRVSDLLELREGEKSYDTMAFIESDKNHVGKRALAVSNELEMYNGESYNILHGNVSQGTLENEIKRLAEKEGLTVIPKTFHTKMNIESSPSSSNYYTVSFKTEDEEGGIHPQTYRINHTNPKVDALRQIQNIGAIYNDYAVTDNPGMKRFFEEASNVKAYQGLIEDLDLRSGMKETVHNFYPENAERRDRIILRKEAGNKYHIDYLGTDGSLKWSDSEGYDSSAAAAAALPIVIMTISNDLKNK